MFFLDQAMAVCAGVTLLSYALYSIEAKILAARPRNGFHAVRGLWRSGLSAHGLRGRGRRLAGGRCLSLAGDADLWHLLGGCGPLESGTVVDKKSGAITGISRAEVQFKTPSGIWLKPTTWKSLSQWWGLFGSVRLMLPAVHVDSPPAGYMRLPDFLECRELYSLDRPIGYFERRRTILRRAPSLLEGLGLLYLVHARHEVEYLYTVAKRMGIPVFTEFHGDAPECVLSETTERS